jgi:hypothetical protein
MSSSAGPGDAVKLIDLVDFLFSKNAGPYLITFDIIFKNLATFDRARNSGVLNREKIAALYHVPIERVGAVYEYKPGRIIKFSITREISSGDFGDRSVFGSQQWAPLIDVEIPASSGRGE